MAKSANQKLKILYLLKILQSQTDEDHALTMNQLIDRLAEYDITAERKSLYDDIKSLQDFGVDIICDRSKNGGYRVVGRDFQLPELKLLVDSVQSSKFLTHKKSAEMIKKLESLCSEHEAKQLQRQVYVANRVKNMNESIYHNVDHIHNGILQNKKIKFKYFEYTVDKERVFRKNGEFYVISPYALMCDDENYYMLGYDLEAGIMKHYRVDKMMHIDLCDQPRDGEKQAEKLDIGAYSGKLFSMFGGDEQLVKIEFDNSLIGVVIDRFGKDVSVIKTDDNHFAVHIKAVVSPQFFGWLAGLGVGAKILYPSDVQQKMKEYIKSIAKLY
ncbi:MAG: WYL domain-containing protein [Clostridia bacterium]|nr:WYL domain-containing protein [Clostridia bacterium]